MAGEIDDPERRILDDPHAPPQALADIAARRWDLHPLIAAHPRAYPELRAWMSAVNPGQVVNPAPYPHQPAHIPPYTSGPHPMPPRRRGIGCWLAGCGCLTLIAGFFVVALVLGGLGSLTAGGGTNSPDPVAGDELSQNLATYESELESIRTLSADFEGNPVAPLILDRPKLDELAADAADPDLSVFGSRSLVTSISGIRANLEKVVTAAQQRRTNASGTTSEAIVDAAGNGYIDILWDAEDSCGGAAEGKSTVGCTAGGSSPLIRVMPDSYYDDPKAMEHVVLHELAHLYQSADAARFDGQQSDEERLLAQGLFQGSNESMADCYALTYQGSRTLTMGSHTLGYGYVCNDAERQAIREWAAELNAPMPG